MLTLENLDLRDFYRASMLASNDLISLQHREPTDMNGIKLLQDKLKKLDIREPKGHSIQDYLGIPQVTRAIRNSIEESLAQDDRRRELLGNSARWPVGPLSKEELRYRVGLFCLELRNADTISTERRGEVYNFVLSLSRKFLRYSSQRF